MDATTKQETLREIFENEELSLIFEEFLISRYAWENIGFWFDVEEYKSINDASERKNFAKLIYDKYLDPSSPFELGDVDPEMRELIHGCLNNPPLKLFNILQHRTFLLLSHSNVIPFLSDEIYLNYMASKNQEKRATKNTSGYDYLYKLIMVGEFGCGKSALVSRFIRKEFQSSKIQQGVEFDVKILKTQNGSKIKFQIWDTAGQEKHNSLTSLYFRGIAGAVIVYDVTDRNSFRSVEKWLNLVKESSESSVSILLIANKADKTNERAITTQEGSDYAKQNNLRFYECSASSGNNVEEAFQSIMSDVYMTSGNNDALEKESVSLNDNDIFDPNSPSSSSSSSSRSCNC